MGRTLWGQFNVTGEAANDQVVVLVGQPAAQESDDWWKLVSDLTATEGVEIAKLVQHDPKSASIGSVWRIQMPLEVYQQIGEVIPDFSDVDPPKISPAPVQMEGGTGYEPLDAIFTSFSAQRLDRFLVVTGVPKDTKVWKEAVIRLLVDGGAREISKIYRPGPGMLAFWWRIVVPLEGIQALEQGPRRVAQAPRKPRATVDAPPLAVKPRKGVKAEEFTKLPEDRRAALRRWLIVNRASEPLRRDSGEIAAAARAAQEYQKRVKAMKLKDGKVTRMPLFDPFFSTSRLVIIDRVAAMEGFKAPGSGIDLESLPSTSELERR